MTTGVRHVWSVIRIETTSWQADRRTLTAEDTEALGARIGTCLRAGDVVALMGPLGAGKTCLVRGLAAGLGIRERVASPTFILMRQHRGNPGLCHADAYRLSGPLEFEDLGIEDILAHSVLAVEWAERVIDALPDERVEIALSYDGDCGRRVEVTARGGRLAAAVEEALS